MFCDESRERKDENEGEGRRESVCMWVCVSVCVYVCVSINDPSRLCQPDKRVIFP